MMSPDSAASSPPADRRFLIVDGHAYAYRAFYAIRQLTSPAGAPTNAIYGFIRMLVQMRAALQPAFVAVIWDGGLAAERLQALPEYKAQRPEMPADLGRQLDEIVSYLEAAQVASFIQDGIEADDQIATLTRHAVAAGMEVVIASSDKDFMQLVSPRVGLLWPNDKSATIRGDADVRAKTGVGPEQIVDWLSLMGDSVDNIPGVPGVGPRTATELLQRFGSVKALYGRLEEVKSDKLRASLERSGDAVRRNLQLVRLKDDLPCEFSPATFASRPGAAERLRELFARWGFRGMLAELEKARMSQAELL